jgi:hypothetical protein
MLFDWTCATSVCAGAHTHKHTEALKIYIPYNELMTVLSQV